MRSAIALCLLAAVLCTVDATFLEFLLLRVRNTKKSVESIIEQLERIHDNVEKDVDLTVIKERLKKMEEFDKYVNPILDTIRKEVEDAKARGKDAQRCYDAAHNIVKDARYAFYTDAERCQVSAKRCISNNLSFIDNLITNGRNLIEELDNIFPDCYKKNSRFIDILKLHNCIKKQLDISTVRVKNLKTDASSAKSTAKNAFNVVHQQSIDCLKNAYLNTHPKIKEARETATRCLKAI
ncbi:PREDICTED: uncharacterized protein LOC105459087 [Wasmannia auropunctata]|uniref:uncharacterized protein LOC105459087 n=1 Tax=Wasmannia auropunctata TaxID=64793 RepID=UPI0005EF0D5B|nr:PREDICTED: uncharacterized protein LOC105459087 [Wasmannia auropunctata]